MIRLGRPASLTAKGQRNNNEDSFRIGENGVFVVCDGVGGVEKGEVASEIVADTFVAFYRKEPAAEPDHVLREAEKALSEHIEVNPDSKGMATTLTFSQVRPEGILVAWVGDSRVYQFRKGSIVYVTNDHSWVNEAVDSGILTPEEAIDHPKSNVITRAVQGQSKPTKVDKVLLTDLLPGDCILHCSDGVLEAWDDNDLSALFNSNDDVEEIVSQLKYYCESESRDNFTAIVYRIEEVSMPQKPHPSPSGVPIDENLPEFMEFGNATLSEPGTGGRVVRKIFTLPVILSITLMLTIIGFTFQKKGFFVGKMVSKDSLGLQQGRSSDSPGIKVQADTFHGGQNETRKDSIDSLRRKLDKYTDSILSP